MRPWLIALAAFLLPAAGGASDALAEKLWNHGSEDCARNRDPAIEVFQFDADTYILRQNKCVHYEAPFIYVLFGKHTVFVQDTGATVESSRFPLYDTVRTLVARRNQQAVRILVTHSHSHSDHTAADVQFRGQPGVTLVEPSTKAVREHFGLSRWPEGSAAVDLGDRTLEVFPAPGHQDEGIVVHDPRTGWLLTGDNVYPGRLYVKSWNEYRSSIRRLAELAKSRRISAVLGTHIEISRSGKLFDAGSTYQPDEAALALTVEDLLQLDQALQAAGNGARDIAMAKFVVVPIGAFSRMLGKILGWLGVR
jgi:glyoxylase-like metal-dependent hydrolase (beta-lactamase superfamily II)